MTPKAALRQTIRARRRALSPDQRQEETTALLALLEPLVAGVTDLASYLALGDEIDLRQLHDRWWRAGRAVWLPRVQGLDLTWHAVRSPATCRPGSFGVLEPDPGLVPAAPLPPQATILVPGVAFDAQGGRLGQGKGFYDRALAHHAGPTIGLGFTCQEVPRVPREAHDLGLGTILLGGRRLTPG